MVKKMRKITEQLKEMWKECDKDPKHVAACEADKKYVQHIRDLLECDRKLKPENKVL